MCHSHQYPMKVSTADMHMLEYYQLPKTRNSQSLQGKPNTLMAEMLSQARSLLAWRQSEKQPKYLLNLMNAPGFQLLFFLVVLSIIQTMTRTHNRNFLKWKCLNKVCKTKKISTQKMRQNPQLHHKMPRQLTEELS